MGLWFMIWFDYFVSKAGTKIMFEVGIMECYVRLVDYTKESWNFID